MRTINFNSRGLYAGIIIDTALINICQFEPTDLPINPWQIENNDMTEILFKLDSLIGDRQEIELIPDERWLRFVDFDNHGGVYFMYNNNSKYNKKYHDLSFKEKSDIILMLLNDDVIFFKYLIKINNFLKLHDLEPIEAKDIRILASFELSPNFAFSSFDSMRIAKICGKPLDPFKYEQSKMINDKFFKLRKELLKDFFFFEKNDDMKVKQFLKKTDEVYGLAKTAYDILKPGKNVSCESLIE